MLDCRNLDFSPKLAAERLASAEKVFGKKILRRVIAFALFILGVNRARISGVLSVNVHGQSQPLAWRGRQASWSATREFSVSGC